MARGFQQSGTYRFRAGNISWLDGATAFTLALWWRRRSVASEELWIGGGTSASARTGLAPWSSSTVYALLPGNLYAQFSNGDTNWHRLVWRFDGTLSGNARSQIWQDNAPVSLSYTGTPPTTCSTNGASWDFGYDQPNGGVYKEGAFSDIGLWDRALSADACLSLSQGFTATHFRIGLRHYWPFSGRGGAASDEEEWVSGATAVRTNDSPVLDNPRIIYLDPIRRIFTPTVAGALTVALSGLSASAAVNSLTATVTSDAAVTLTAVTAAAAVNDLNAAFTLAETLTGVSAAGAVGNLSAGVSADAAVTLTGVSASGAVGSLTGEIVSDALTVTLTGLSASAAVGTLSAVSDTADSVSLAGGTAASAVGNLSAVANDVLTEALAGISAEAAVSSITATISDADALTAVTAQSAVGVLTADVSSDFAVPLVGVSAASAVGDLTTSLSLQLEVTLTGVSATGSVRDLRVPEDQPQIDEAIRDALKHLVKGNIYPLRRPQRETQQQANAHLPEIVYTIVSDDWLQAETICGVGLHNIRVQIDIYAQHYREARAFAYAAAAEMDNLGWRINMQPFPDDDEKIYRWQLEYSCWRNEAPPGLPLTRTHRG